MAYNPYQNYNSQGITIRDIDDILKQQDKDLEMLHQGMVDVKQTAIYINDEVKEQNVILDDTLIKAGNTENQIKNRIESVKKFIKEDKGSCAFIIVIIILIIIIILLSAILAQ